MIETIYFIAGCVISWLVAYLYYYRTSTRAPKWAEGLIQNLPANPPKPSELLRLFQEHLNSGEVEFNYPLGRVACPECGAPASDFDEKIFGDDAHTIVVYTCRSCGWTDDAEV